MARDLAREMYRAFRSAPRRSRKIEDESRTKIDDPKLVSDVLDELIQKRDWVRGLAEGNVFTDWENIVGKEVAQHSTPISLTEGRLTIQSSSTAWATQLNLMKEELLKTITNSDDKTVGVVGFVDISNDCSRLSFFTLYQLGEYYFAQCLKRLQQSLITHKVNCLSGCVQVLKICEETCGDYILQKFNYLPSEKDNIFNHIRSYASEDRNHICIMMSEYPYVQTKQNLNAISYTKIPMSNQVFLSQRRRWNLGAICNDMLLATKPEIILYERISAIVNLITYITTPFIFIATIFSVIFVH